MEGSPFDNTFSRQYTYPIESIDLDDITSYEIPNVIIVKRDLFNYIPPGHRTVELIDSLKLDLETTLRDIPGVNITDVDIWFLEEDNQHPINPDLFEITLIIEYGDDITDTEILSYIDTRLRDVNVLPDDRPISDPPPEGWRTWQTIYTHDSSLCPDNSSFSGVECVCDEGYELNNDECNPIPITDTR
jgi:hypothetical protein